MTMSAETKERKREERKKILFRDMNEAYAGGMDMNATSLQQQEKGSIGRSIYDRAVYYHGRPFDWGAVLLDAGLPADKIIRQGNWNAQKVITALQNKKADGGSLNASAMKDVAGLTKAMKRCFGSHDKALIAAGFDPERVRKAGPSLSKAEIIEAIKEAYSSGKDLNETVIIHNYDAKLRSAVYAAQKRFEEGWAEAVKEAGINYDDFRQRVARGYWTRDTVMSSTIELHDAGEDMSATNLSKNHSDLMHAMGRYLGSHEKALKKCGINPDSFRKKSRSLSRKELKKEIQCLKNQGYGLSVTEMTECPELRVRSIHNQAVRRFGSWEKAVKASGFSYEEIRQHRAPYTRDKLVSFFRKEEHSGTSLRRTSVIGDPRLKKYLRAVDRRFGSWENFLIQGGFDVARYHTARVNWEEGRGVIKYLRENYPAGMVTGIGSNRNLSAAVCMYFHSVREAVSEAGLFYSRHGRITQEMISDPDNVKILLQCNEKFLQQIADKVYFSAKRCRMKSINPEDLASKAFTKFIEILPKKPVRAGIREFTYEPIRKHLVRLNGQEFHEEELYLEVFGKEKVGDPEDED